MKEYGKRLIAMEPNFAGGHQIIRIASYATLQYDQAIKASEIAIRLNPDIMSYYCLGMTYALKKDMENVKAILEKILTMSREQNGVALLGVCLQLLEIGIEPLNIFTKLVKCMMVIC